LKKLFIPLDELEMQRREIEVLKICQQSSVIKLLDLFENADYLYIVLEILPGGDLYDYLDKRDFKITEDRARELASVIGEGIKYFHGFGVVHRDLKLENILMTNSTDTAVPKITDFGLSALIGPGENIKDACGTIVTFKVNLTDLCCT
jgi:serine/threonine protein kinase